MGKVKVLVGAQWGDEGKGKWIDILAKDADLVARYQGGNNAGHTLYVDGEKIVLHQIPSGVFQNKASALTAGVVINPSELVKEIEKIKHQSQLNPSRLWLSARAHVISPWHIFLDGKNEANASQPIGTTKRGIGPTYADKANRTGIRLGDYVQTARRQQWIERRRREDPVFDANYLQEAEAWQEFEQAARTLEPFVCDAEARIRQYLREDKCMLFEGAQGVLLDIDHGTYPYVTSSSTAANGAFSSVGFSSQHIDHIFGVAKAYATRVGEGPFPTELNDAVGEKLAKNGHEFGATTGRPRRCGWLDGVALRYCLEVNGIDSIILNKMDILNDFEEILVAEAYEHPKHGKLTDFPWDPEILNDCRPVYKSFQGWMQDIPQSGRISDLPAAAQAYIEGVESIIGGRISMVGTGVNRSDGLFR